MRLVPATLRSPSALAGAVGEVEHPASVNAAAQAIAPVFSRNACMVVLLDDAFDDGLFGQGAAVSAAEAVSGPEGRNDGEKPADGLALPAGVSSKASISRALTSGRAPP